MLPRRVDGAAVRAINTCQVMNSERHLFGPNEGSVRQAAGSHQLSYLESRGRRGMRRRIKDEGQGSVGQMA